MPGMPGSGEVTPEEWEASLGALQELYVQSSGLEQKKLEAQIRDAEEGRKNSMAIARLQSETSRYGVDAQRQTALAQLKQRAREFEQTHALELRKFGLSYAQTATEYLATPDRYFAAADFLNMASRQFAGQPGVAPYGQGMTPTPKTEQDFAALASGANPLQGGRPAASSPQSVQSNLANAGASSAATAAIAPQGSQQSAGSDARVKAMKAVLDAAPPSGVQGLNDTDFAVLQSIKSIASMPQRPGTFESLRPGQQGILKSGLGRLGYYAPDIFAQYERNRPGQNNPRMAG